MLQAGTDPSEVAPVAGLGEMGNGVERRPSTAIRDGA